MASDKDFIVAIEIGSSRISGIAGRKKDGVMQVLAYAEEKSDTYVQRGVILNIEKTYQSINAIISKLEATLKNPIARAYIGVAGQSVRSYKKHVKRNMGAHSYITSECIEGIRNDSYDIPFTDCQILRNFPQGFVIDGVVVETEPVGRMGTIIEGKYINIIANKRLLNNITTTLENTSVKIADILLTPYELCEQVLTDIEKRSGCAVVDLGAETTTVIVYMNRVIRYLVTLPIGMNNINKDLATLSILEDEAEDVKMMFGDAKHTKHEDDKEKTFISKVGTEIKVELIRNVIEARLEEIITNVKNQLIKSTYSDKLLKGIILVGGGSKMKNIEAAFQEATKIETIRVASAVDTLIQKASGMGNPAVFETPVGLSVLSLLLAGKENCAGTKVVEEQAQTDLITQMEQEAERERIKKEQEERDRADIQCALEFDAIKNKIRSQLKNVTDALAEVRKHGGDKKVRESAEKIAENALNVITEDFQQHVDTLSSKEKYKQTATEGTQYAQQLREATTQLRDAVLKAKEDNKFFNRIGKFITDMVSEN